MYEFGIDFVNFLARRAQKSIIVYVLWIFILYFQWRNCWG